MQMPSISFTGVVGRKFVDQKCTPDEKTINTTLVYHPFEDEGGISKEQLDKVKKEYIASKEFTEIAKKGILNNVKVVIGERLPFNINDFLLAKQYPKCEEVNELAVAFVNSDDYGTTTYKECPRCHVDMYA